MIMCWTAEFRDLEEGERVLFETDDKIEYAWVLFTLSTFEDRFETISRTPLLPGKGVILK